MLLSARYRMSLLLRKQSSTHTVSSNLPSNNVNPVRPSSCEDLEPHASTAMLIMRVVPASAAPHETVVLHELLKARVAQEQRSSESTSDIRIKGSSEDDFSSPMATRLTVGGK